jgi:hypothetical protein
MIFVSVPVLQRHWVGFVRKESYSQAMKLTFSALKYLRRRQYRGALFMRLKPEIRTHGRVRGSVGGRFTATSLSLHVYGPVGMLAGVLGTVP